MLVQRGTVLILPDTGVYWELRLMVQEGWWQLRCRGSSIPSQEGVMEYGTHKLLGMPYVVVCPRILHQSKMLLVPVELYIWKQPRMVMKLDQQ